MVTTRPSEARVFWKALMDNVSALIISPHSLRHAAITNALDAGVPLRDADLGPSCRPAHH